MMAEADAVASGVVTGGGSDNHDAGAQQNQSGAQASAASGDWESSLAEEFKGTVKAKGWKGPNDVLKSYVELEKYSSKALQDMGPEERERMYKRLGRPEKPGEYELSGMTLPDGFPRNAKADEELKAFAHENGFTKAQLKALHEWSVKRTTEAFISNRQTEARKREEAESAFRKEMGDQFDAANTRIDSLIVKFGGDEGVKYFNEGPGRDPVMRRFLHNIAKVMSEETFVAGGVAPMDRTGGLGMVVDFSKSPEISGNNRYGRR